MCCADASDQSIGYSPNLYTQELDLYSTQVPVMDESQFLQLSRADGSCSRLSAVSVCGDASSVH
jgi:hypothetical protein